MWKIVHNVLGLKSARNDLVGRAMLWYTAWLLLPLYCIKYHVLIAGPIHIKYVAGKIGLCLFNLIPLWYTKSYSSYLRSQ